MQLTMRRPWPLIWRTGSCHVSHAIDQLIPIKSTLSLSLSRVGGVCIGPIGIRHIGRTRCGPLLSRVQLCVCVCRSTGWPLRPGARFAYRVTIAHEWQCLSSMCVWLFGSQLTDLSVIDAPILNAPRKKNTNREATFSLCKWRCMSADCAMC